jgi:hypothetical protein
MNCRSALTALILAALLWLAAPACQGQEASPAPPPPEAAGALRVKTDITGAQIYLDGQEKGTTPTTLRGLAAGAHQLALVKDGYEAHEQAVTVTAGKTELVMVTMKPLTLPPPQLPAVFRAVHQHSFGSCIGTLTVTADAIEYAGDDKDDRFRIPIRTLKSVSRSFGPIPGLGPTGIGGPGSMMACRVEAPDRAYGFWAVEKGMDDDAQVIAAKTKELFQVLYRLWTDTLKKPGP